MTVTDEGVRWVADLPELADRVLALQVPDGIFLDRERVEVYNMGLREAALLVRAARIRAEGETP